MRIILGRLGDPHLDVPMVHVAGTRGKGSTCALLESAFRAAGHRTGLTTSPHLRSPCERIRIDGIPVLPERLLDLAGRVREAAAGLDPGYFEVMTAAAFLAFVEHDVGVAVVEVGLGGRLDATNVVEPVACAITRLGLDHADRLGATRAAIATEKAGILKKHVTCILAPNHPDAVAAVLARAEEVGAPVRLLTLDDVRSAPATSLPGEAQRENAAVAAAVLEKVAFAPGLAVSADDRDRGFLSTRWPARLELLAGALSQSPRIDLLLDVAHDVDSVAVLCDHVRGSRPRALVFACLAGKDLDGMTAVLAACEATRGAVVVVPELPGARSRPAAEVVAALDAAGMSAERAEDVRAALARARVLAKDGGLVAAFGSFVLAGEVLGSL